LSGHGSHQANVDRQQASPLVPERPLATACWKMHRRCGSNPAAWAVIGHRPGFHHQHAPVSAQQSTQCSTPASLSCSLISLPSHSQALPLSPSLLTHPWVGVVERIAGNADTKRTRLFLDANILKFQYQKVKRGVKTAAEDTKLTRLTRTKTKRQVDETPELHSRGADHCSSDTSLNRHADYNPTKYFCYCKLA
jgi:hypothetical protein